MTAPGLRLTRCLPGCERHSDDRDGSTYCSAVLGEPAFTLDPTPRPVTVEVDQHTAPDGEVRRMVAVVCAGDPVLVDPADVPALAAALVDAARLARDGRR